MTHEVRCRAPRLIPIAAFVTGFASIATEVSASRLIGPYFGSSTFIWANLIGLTLLFLTAGYSIGGKIADRWPSLTLLFLLTSCAGFAVALIPTIARPILHASLSAFDSVA